MEAVMQQSSYRRHRARYIVGGVILVLLIVLIAARLYLPVWLKDHVNKTLDNIPGYQGSIAGIDVHLYRGAYQIQGLTLKKVNGGIPVPFLDIDTTDFSLQWGALFDGRIVSDVHLYRPRINFAKGRGGAEQTGEGTDWTQPIRELMPIDINLVEINNGRISYRDFSSSPEVNIFVENLNGTVNELRNTEDKNVALPSTINLTGTSIGGGKMGIKGKLNALSEWIDMDVDGHLENADLTAFNKFVDAYAAFQFDSGNIDIYTEMAIKDGAIDGYIKPIVRNLSVKPAENPNPLEVAWAGIAAFFLELFQNQPRDQFATKVPLTGHLTKVGTETWPTIVGVFRNAFVEAFERGTDGEITFNPKPGDADPAKGDGSNGETREEDAPSGEAKNAEPNVDALVPNFGK